MRVKDLTALQRCKFDTQLLAAGSLTIIPIIAYDILNNNKYSEMEFKYNFKIKFRTNPQC